MFIKKLNRVLMSVALITSANIVCSAQLCGTISTPSLWDGGVFSVVDDKGQTVATTDFIIKGNAGCSNNFKSGRYFIRFNGGQQGKPTPPYKNVFGCITAPFLFEEERMTVVFDQGRHPFNGNVFCRPSVP